MSPRPSPAHEGRQIARDKGVKRGPETLLSVFEGSQAVFEVDLADIIKAQNRESSI
jgi:hypothetical protein